MFLSTGGILSSFQFSETFFKRESILLLFSRVFFISLSENSLPEFLKSGLKFFQKIFNFSLVISCVIFFSLKSILKRNCKAISLAMRRSPTLILFLSFELQIYAENL